ncbi:putative peptide ABC transporter,substrate-binding protein [metagenome]|uniref:Putative peptide ABC transporter,substrate-binding protein n=1 Tax=metagenome TaxID=256318 RepID=A0A2P2C278_9ZZZZ
MTQDRRSEGPDSGGGAFTRRRLLQVGGVGALVLASGGLAACSGSGSDPNTSTSGGGASPSRGGSLRVGATGGGNGDTLEAQFPLTNMDFIRVGAMFEQLVQINGSSGQPEMVLAESVEPNANATQWTIRVKPDITFHDGKPLTATDVLYSLRRIEKNNFPGLIAMGPVDLASAKVMDDLTLRIPFDSPYGILLEGLSGITSLRMVPEGYDPAKPVGTGPFTFGSFTAGQESRFTRFDDYWQDGQPYLDELVITNFADETAQLNALQSGELDLVDQLSSASVPIVESAGGKAVVSKTRGFVPLTMRVDQAPFSDVRVRQALRLLINRDEFNQQVFGGLGEIGNDVFGGADAAYEGSVPQREQDVEQAKSLLRSAGQSDLQIELYSSPIAPGASATASVFAAQAEQAGVSVKIRTQDPSEFFSQSYSKVPFALSFWNTASYLTQAQQGTAPGAPFNEIHQTDSDWDGIYNEALATVDPTARGELVQKLIKFDYDQGGYIIPAYFPMIEGMTAGVGGITENVTGLPINGSTWQSVWLTS